MLLYNTRRAVFKNGDGCTLLCDITLPCGAEDGELNKRIARFYKGLYEVVCSTAKEYVGRTSSPNGCLIKLNVRCEEYVKGGKLIVKCTCVVSMNGVDLKRRVFVDKFPINVTKQRNIP